MHGRVWACVHVPTRRKCPLRYANAKPRYTGSWPTLERKVADPRRAKGTPRTTGLLQHMSFQCNDATAPAVVVVVVVVVVAAVRTSLEKSYSR